MLKNLVLEFEDILALVFLFHLECHVHSQLAVERLINVAYSSISKLAKVEIVLPQAKDRSRRKGEVLGANIIIIAQSRNYQHVENYIVLNCRSAHKPHFL